MESFANTVAPNEAAATVALQEYVPTTQVYDWLAQAPVDGGGVVGGVVGGGGAVGGVVGGGGAVGGGGVVGGAVGGGGVVGGLGPAPGAGAAPDPPPPPHATSSSKPAHAQFRTCPKQRRSFTRCSRIGSQDAYMSLNQWGIVANCDNADSAAAISAETA